MSRLCNVMSHPKDDAERGAEEIVRELRHYANVHESLRDFAQEKMLRLAASMIESILAAARIREAPVEPAWGDKPDQFSERVKAAHPVICKDDDRHARYALALEMIHSRHSKYALVDLVNWLLTKWPELQAEAKR